MGKPLSLLLLEDSEDDAALVLRELRREGHAVDCERVDTVDGYLRALDRGGWDLVIADFSMPGFSGREALDLLRGRGLDTPFVFVSGTIGEEAAVDAMKAGASDYILKGRLLRLVPAIERELRDAEVRRQRRQAEEALHHLGEQLQQARRLESIGRLAAGVAHDFNNMLTVVLGACDLWELRHGDETPPSELAMIRNAADSAAALTRQLLAFGRHQVLKPRRLDLSSVVARAERLLGRVLGEHVELVTELDGTGRAVVRADPGQLEQVIVNLAANARDAMPGGGRLRIGTSTFELDEAAARQAGSEPGRYVELTVSDTGVGIDSDTLEHLFEPFFTTKETGKGTGLGLATVYGIVTQSGGYVEVDSEHGRGATFRVCLPRAEGPVEETVRSAAPAATGGQETVLVAEDDEAVRLLTCRLLEGHGYTVLAAPDGRSALSLARRHPGPIHLLLTDLVMPGMTGPALAEQMAAIRPQAKVLFTSGYASSDALGHGFAVDEGAFLEKPFSSANLGRKVREALSRG